jgi:hypothetical protein
LRVSPAAGVYRVKDGYLRLVDDPQGVIESVGGVFLGRLGLPFRLPGVALVALAIHAVAQVLRLGCGVGFHRLPLALRVLGGLPGLRLDGILTGRDICLSLVYARLDLLIRLVPGLVGGTLQVLCSLLQGVYLLGNAHELLLDLGRRSAEAVMVPGPVQHDPRGEARSRCPLPPLMRAIRAG